ncbi:MAG: homocysteine biosynthesis protein [Clostridia bacterium]
MRKTYKEINNKIKTGEVVVVSVEEAINITKKSGIKKASEYIDIVTTATFGPMCSSGAFLNFGHSDPPIRLSKTLLNGVLAYSGIAAVDTYIGATEQNEKKPNYGGANVIFDLVSGKEVELIGYSKGSDCYPSRYVNRRIRLSDLNEAYLYNPRNAYQNYSGAINTSDKDIYTYMGRLKANMDNINFSTTGQMSPLLKDPQFRTIGIGTRIYLAGAKGYVSWYGTQFDSAKECNSFNIPKTPSGTIATIGDLKDMKAKYLKPIYLKNYGVSLNVGIAIPIPILDENLLAQVVMSNKEITTQIVDYSTNPKRVIKEVTYEQLNKGFVNVNGKIVKTYNLSNTKVAKELEAELVKEMQKGNFLLQEPIELFSRNKSVKKMVVN